MDPEEGALPGARFTWRVDFHHETHVHPFIPDTSGSQGGSFQVPTTGHTAADVWYRIHLTVTDSGGLSHSTFRDVMPRTSAMTLATNIPGLQLRLDSQPVSAPHTVTSVVGIERDLDAPSPQTVGGTTYEFVSWSDGGAQSHTIPTPAADTTYTATYREVAGLPGGLVGYWAFDEGSGSVATDGSGNGYNGSLQYGPTWTTSVACRIGGCLSFDGIGRLRPGPRHRRAPDHGRPDHLRLDPADGRTHDDGDRQQALRVRARPGAQRRPVPVALVAQGARRARSCSAT